MEKNYWWVGFNIPENTDEPGDDSIPFEYWCTGSGDDYFTMTALVPKSVASTEDEICALLEENFTIKKWRWSPEEHDGNLGNRFPRKEKQNDLE